MEFVIIVGKLRVKKLFLPDLFMVPGARIELARGYPHQILSLARLPVPPSRHEGASISIPRIRASHLSCLCDTIPRHAAERFSL
jgi:hypothetical protein